ncbi:MAG: hypothetical protein PVH61_33930 [Candidatus Aminicenantes bacterium]|jgi:hypothetical protein
MAILKKLCVGILVFLFMGRCLTASQSLVLIDKSGSMKGFFNTGSLENVYNGVNLVLSASAFPGTQLFGFAAKGLQEYKKFDSMEVGGYTVIHQALQQALDKQPNLIIIITDNIPFASAEDEEHDISKFYSLLKEDMVEWVFIIPLQMDFDGKIFPADKNKASFAWKGQRASILYAILLKKDNLTVQERRKREEDFLKTVAAVEGAVQSLRIRCKPLEKGVVFSVRKVKKIGKHINITSEGIKVNFKSFNASPRFGLKLRLASKYSNIAVRQAVLEGIALGKAKAAGLFKEIDKKDLRISIAPNVTDLEPGQVDEDCRIEINCKKLDYDKDIFSLLKMPFAGNGEIYGNFRIKIRIPKGNLQLIPAIMKKYNTQNIDDPKGIFRLNELVPMLAPGEEIQINKNIKFHINMPYPGWAIFVFLGLLALVVLLGWLGVIVYKNSRHRFNVIINRKEQDQVITAYPVIWCGLYSDDAGKIGKIKIRGNMVVVEPMPGYRWENEEEDAPLSRQFIFNDSFTLISDEEDAFLVELVPLESPIKHKKEADDEENEFFED